MPRPGVLAQQPHQQQHRQRCAQRRRRRQRVRRIAQETLSRCLRRLADLGCIVVKGYVATVRDLQALQWLAASPVV